MKKTNKIKGTFPTLENLKKLNRIPIATSPNELLSNGILKKSRQKRWQKYNGLTYSEAIKLLEHWKWHSQKLENLLAKIIKAEKDFKESTDIKTDIDAIEKRTKLIEKAEKILNSDVIWTGGY